MFVATNGILVVGPFDTPGQATVFCNMSSSGFRVCSLTSAVQYESGGTRLEVEAKRLVFIYRSKVHAIKALREWGQNNLGFTPTLHECVEIFRPIWPGGWYAEQ